MKKTSSQPSNSEPKPKQPKIEKSEDKNEPVSIMNVSVYIVIEQNGTYIVHIETNAWFAL